ncbi:MAG: phosphate ABC transporter substrate-binding protein PstS [Elusimicrobiota bacterium]
MKMTKIVTAGFMAIGMAFGSVMPVRAETSLSGAGATFPYPIYSKWFDEYHREHSDIKINYQSIGSGGGIRQFTARTVDFGATDGPMTDKQLFSVDGKVLHIPTVLGAVVPAYNVSGVDDLKFSPEVLAGIFLGNIKTWSDPAIKAINPTATLPDMPITVVRRSDGSGTTYIWTDFLSKVSPEWQKKVGKGTSVNWPVGLGGKGNEGVAGTIKQIKNSIGYVELIYAKQNNIDYAAVRNASGKFVKADIASVTAAAASAAKNMPKDYRVSITNAAGDDVYPIASFTWLLVYEKNPGANGQVLKNFLGWMLEKGQSLAPDLGYAPLPESVKKMVEQTVNTIK